MSKKKASSSSRKKKTASEIAKTAASAAVAAVTAASEDEEVSVGSWLDQDDDDEEELLAGLDEIDGADEIATWELGCREPFARRGTIRFPVMTDEIRNIKQELIDQHGPGVYYIRAKNSRGKWVKQTYRTIRISASAKPPALAPAAAVASSSNDPLSVIRELELREERRRSERKSEWREELKFWSPLLLAVAPKLVEVVFGRGESVKDLVQALAAMKQLNGDQATPWIDQVKSVLELSRELGGDQRGATWPDLAKEALTSFGPAVKHVIEQRTAPQTSNGSTPPSQPPATPALSAPPNGGVDPMWAIVEPLLKRLAQDLQDYAQNGAKIEIVAEALYAKIPSGMLTMVPAEQLRTWLTQENWWEAIQAFWPPLAPYHTYCDQVRQLLLQIVQEEFQSEDTTAEFQSEDTTTGQVRP